jgi:hypothetical protein
MKRTMILIVAAMLFAGWRTSAAGEADLAKENAELKARVDKLEQELGEIKKLVEQQGEMVKAKAEPNSPAARTPEAAKPAVAKKPVVSGLDVELYGRLKFDAAYDDSRIDNGNYARWVQSEATNKDDSQFNMTARETRLGMRIYGPDTGDIKTSGRVEADFYGSGEENKAGLMMRHAYMNIEWPQDKFSILAGQTSDVISPLYPDTLNYTVGWWAGNIGYRRPQLRLTKGYTLDKDVELKIEGAIARTIGLGGSFTPGDAGEDAGIPSFQARTSVTFPSWGYKPTTIGVSGHWAKEEFDTTANGANDKFDSWSLNLDILQPVNKHLTLKGELFTGKNLAAYLGGIGQGVRNIGTPTSPVYDKEISSRGGWLAAGLGPWDKWSFNVGISVDDPDNDDLGGVTDNNREYNRAIFGNVIYAIDKNADIGFELSQWKTKYTDQDDADALRGQMSLIYKF